VAAPDDDIDRVNWSIRLVGDEVTQWDELLYRLRRETRRRTLSKADIMRALVELAANDESTRQALIAAL
jgi:chlorite dismutase